MWYCPEVLPTAKPTFIPSTACSPICLRLAGFINCTERSGKLKKLPRNCFCEFEETICLILECPPCPADRRFVRNLNERAYRSHFRLADQPGVIASGQLGC